MKAPSYNSVICCASLSTYCCSRKTAEQMPITASTIGGRLNTGSRRGSGVGSVGSTSEGLTGSLMRVWSRDSMREL